MSKVYYVYEHWRLDRDECFYVGKGFRSRAYSRSHRNSHWKNIVAKLERLGFAYEVRIVASGLSEEEAFSLEKERISFWRNLVDLANITSGGEGLSGMSHSDETKQKMSLAAKKRLSAPGMKEILSARFKGRAVSEEAKRKMSLLKKGKPLSEEHRKNLSKSLKGKGRTPETKARMSEAARLREAKKRGLCDG